MSHKQLVLGAKYVKWRAVEALKSHNYVNLISMLQKSFVDTMRHRRRSIEHPYTIPIFLHRNDVANGNLNLRKLSKILMKDMLANEEDGQFVIKFFINERYAQRRHISSELEESLRLLLNKISDTPADLNTTDYKYNRSNELGLYVKSKVDDTVVSLTPKDHEDLLASLSSRLTHNYRIFNSPKQFYIIFEPTHCKLLTSPRDEMEPVITEWKQMHTDKNVKVRIETLELADKIAYIGIHPLHPNYKDLLHTKAINPTTGSEIEIIKVTDEAIVDQDILCGIIPNHILKHRDFCTSNNLSFYKKTDYDFHSAPYLTKLKRFQSIFNITKTSPPIIPIILSPTSIRDQRSGELFEITKFSVLGYINLVEELHSPVVELLLTLDNDSIAKDTPRGNSHLIPTENVWLTYMILKALGLHRQYRAIEVPKIFDFRGREVSKLRLDFNKIYNGVPLDQVCEEFGNKKTLFTEEQYPLDTKGTISIDAIKGMLSNPNEEGTVFDDYHKSIEILRLTLLMGLFNSYSLKFLKKKNLSHVKIDIGFKNIFVESGDQQVKDWNYYMMHRMITNMIEFYEFKRHGDLKNMHRIFSDLLILVNNGYWDLLNSEIMLAAKKPENLPASKVYLKHLMGTVVYYLHLMAQSFYVNEPFYVLKKLPVLRSNYKITEEFLRFEENKEVYENNVLRLQDLNYKLQNYLKVFDNDTLSNGSMMIEIVKLLKEVVVDHHNTKDTYSIFLEVSDMLNFVVVRENQNYLNTIYSIFKATTKFQNRTIKIVTEMGHKFTRVKQPDPLLQGTKTIAVPNCPGIFIHLVKVDSQFVDKESGIEEETEEEEEDVFENDFRKLTFKELLLNEDMQHLLTNDNSQFDKIFNEVLDIEKRRQEEAKKEVNAEAKN